MRGMRVVLIAAAFLVAGVAAAQSVTGTLTGAPTAPPFGTMDFGSQPVGTTGAAQTETITAHLFPAPVPPGFVVSIDSVTSNSGEFQVTGGSCLGSSVLLPDGSDCTVQLAFAPAAAGTRSGALSVQCAVVAVVGTAVFVCDNAVHQFMLMNGLGAAAAVQAAIPTLDRVALTALALLLMLASFYYLRRR